MWCLEGKKGAALLSGGDRTDIIGDAFSSTTSVSHIRGQMAPRWKGKDAKSKKEAEAEALKQPMPKIISQLQSSLVQSNTCGFLSDNCVHLAVQAEQLDLLDKACFGRPVRIVDKDMYWFQLTVEEAFYLCYSLKCLKIKGVADTCPLNDEELWRHFKSKKEAFPYFYKAYSHLRMKNWVVRSGAQYGVDFIVYRHHPARVHSEYGALVLSHDKNGDLNGRLRVWSDVHCTTRLLGSVAKTLLVLYVNKNGNNDPLCLTNYTIEERTISRWSLEQPCHRRSFPEFVLPLPFSRQQAEASSTGRAGKGKKLEEKRGTIIGGGDRTIIGDAFSSTTSISHIRGQMAPRWKGKDAKSKKEAEAEALKEPMSKIISQLQSSLVQSNTCGFLSDNCVHLTVQAEQLDLLDKACFGRPVRIVDKDMYWFQLTVEEAFYLCYSLKCLKINGGADTSPLNDEELWRDFKSKKEAFPYFYKAYSHLRMKNWVVRSGAQYGVDFIVYRHHPARVHSEYGVLVLSHDNDGDLNGRLREWSDVQCTTRLLGSVAKTLLVLYVNKKGHSDESLLCLTNYTIEERTISRWSPEQCRERSI